MKKNTVKQLLLMNNYYSLNKTLVSRLGIEEAFFICLLAEAEQLFKGHERDGYFFQTAKEIEKRSGLSSYKQRTIIASLEEKGLIKTDLKGIPAKRYFKLEYENISNFIFEGEETEKEEVEETAEIPDVKNFNNKESSDPEKGGDLTTRCEKISQQVMKNFNNSESKNSTSNYKESNIKNIYKENNHIEVGEKKEEVGAAEKEIKAITTDREIQEVIKDFTKEDLELIDAIKEFYRARKILKKPLTARALKLNINSLKRITTNRQEQIAIINQSIQKGWQSFYELPKNHPIGAKKKEKDNAKYGFNF
ncbi:hypothetical protein [Peptoniphilus sp.]|uniref:hypothetical protein n=1 Tax=Peptoniphilus sp. TaxID=1971214 RepID=UPI00399293FC